MLKRFFCLALLTAMLFQAKAGTYYISPSGDDAASGSQTKPLRTIREAAQRTKQLRENEPTEIILQAGVHYLDKTVRFDNPSYTEKHPLIIRAEIMPDDKGWHPQFMPTVVLAMPLNSDGGGETINGLEIETSHVTIEGIRFTGTAEYEYKEMAKIRRTYPIWRGGKNLTDLLVKQCLFIGDPVVMPLHVGVIANGNKLVVDHCVFYNTKNPVVFWRAEGGNSIGNAMRNCLMVGSTFSGVWTVEATEDFDFRNNIIYGGTTAWIRDNQSKRKYKVKDCIISGNENLSGYGFGAVTTLTVTPSDFLNMERTKLSGKIELEMDRSKVNFLQLKTGSFGTELNAGLFINKQ